MGTKRIAVLLLTGMLGGFAMFTPMPHAAAQGGAGYGITVGPTVQGTVTEKFSRNDGLTLIMVDGQPYGVPIELYNQVTVGTVVKFDGTDWTIISGGM